MASQRSKASAKNKTPAFKPPRPAAKSKESSKDVGARRKSAPARPPPTFSSSDDDDSEEQADPSVSDSRAPPPLSQEPPPTIPPKLLTRLLHHHFDDEQTRIAKDAKELVGKYMETFVREALARAAYERGRNGGAGKGGDFLEVSSSVRSILEHKSK